MIMPRTESRLLFVDHVERRGRALFNAACERDLEGVVAKWRHGRYETDGITTSWIKIKNPTYSQWTGRRALFEGRSDNRQAQRANWRAPVRAFNAVVPIARRRPSPTIVRPPASAAPAPRTGR